MEGLDQYLMRSCSFLWVVLYTVNPPSPSSSPLALPTLPPCITPLPSSWPVIPPWSEVGIMHRFRARQEHYCSYCSMCYRNRCWQNTSGSCHVCFSKCNKQSSCTIPLFLSFYIYCHFVYTAFSFFCILNYVF